MSTARRVLAPATVLGLAAVMVVAMLWAGPRPGDLPGGVGEVPAWYEADPEQALATVVGFLAWLGLLWLCAGLVFAAFAGLPGAAGRVAGRLARRMLPRALRRLLEIALGIALVAGTAAPALASGTSSDSGGGWPDLDRPSQSVVLAPAVPPPPPRLAPPAYGDVSTDRDLSVVSVSADTGTASTFSGPGFPDLDRPSAPPPTQPAPPSTSDGTTSFPDLDRPSAPPQGSADPLASFPDLDRPSAPPSVPGPPPTVAAPTTAVPLTDTAVPPPATAPPTLPALPTVEVDPPIAVGVANPIEASTQPTGSWPDLDRPSTPPSGPTPGTPPPTSQPPATQPPATQPPPADQPPATDQPPAPEPTPPADPVVPPAPLGPGTADGQTPPAEVVVMRGDTLWTIAARHLGTGATDGEVAAEWPRWWAANQDVIGPDPDVILPGQRLVPPPGP